MPTNPLKPSYADDLATMHKEIANAQIYGTDRPLIELVNRLSRLGVTDGSYIAGIPTLLRMDPDKFQAVFNNAEARYRLHSKIVVTDEDEKLFDYAAAHLAVMTYARARRERESK